MSKAKKERHPTLLETVHETAKGLYDANIINATTVRQWEQGEKHPRGTSMRLLNLVADKGLGVLLSDSSSHNEEAAA